MSKIFFTEAISLKLQYKANQLVRNLFETGYSNIFGAFFALRGRLSSSSFLEVYPLELNKECLRQNYSLDIIVY